MSEIISVKWFGIHWILPGCFHGEEWRPHGRQSRSRVMGFQAECSSLIWPKCTAGRLKGMYQQVLMPPKPVSQAATYQRTITQTITFWRSLTAFWETTSEWRPGNTRPYYSYSWHSMNTKNFGSECFGAGDPKTLAVQTAGRTF